MMKNPNECLNAHDVFSTILMLKIHI